MYIVQCTLDMPEWHTMYLLHTRDLCYIALDHKFQFFFPNSKLLKVVEITYKIYKYIRKNTEAGLEPETIVGSLINDQCTSVHMFSCTLYSCTL